MTGQGPTRCGECGGSLHEKTIVHTQPWGDDLYRFEDVPALVCAQCGSVWLAAQVSQAMDGIEVSVCARLLSDRSGAQVTSREAVVFDFTCSCGETIHASEDHVGLHVKCPRCGGIVKITDPRNVITRTTHPGNIPPTPRTTGPGPRRVVVGSPSITLAVLVLLVVASAVLAYLLRGSPGPPAQSSGRPHPPPTNGLPPLTQRCTSSPTSRRERLPPFQARRCRK